MSNLFIIYTTEEGGEYKVVQSAEGDEGTKQMYSAGGFILNLQPVKFYWKALTRVVISDYAPAVKDQIRKAKK